MKKLFAVPLFLIFISVTLAGAYDLSQFSLRKSFDRNEGILCAAQSFQIFRAHAQEAPQKFMMMDVALPSLPRFLKTYKGYETYSEDTGQKKSLSIYLNGGLSLTDAGDLGQMIKSYNAWSEYIKADLPPEADFSFNWPEFKSMQKFGVEVLYNITPNLSVSLGVESLMKTTKGDLDLDYSYDETWSDYVDYYVEYGESWQMTGTMEQKLSVIPLTLNAYYFFPVQKKVSFFVKGGIGYYLGKLKSNSSMKDEYSYYEDWYDYSTSAYLDSYIYDSAENGSYTYEAKCNALGFHGGIGLDLRFSSNISLILEGGYKYANLKNWKGNADDSGTWRYEEGWVLAGTTTDSGSWSDSFDGKVWYFEDDYDGETLKQIDMFEEGDEPNGNSRLAEIKLSGFSLKIGIMIRF